MLQHLRRLKPEDILTFPHLSGDPQIDPAGETIAYVRGAVVRENTRLARQNIWLVSADGARDRQFTHGPRADLHPRWSPDGKLLAFLSDRAADGKLQVCCMRRDGGEALALTAVAGELDATSERSALQWSPDGRYLSFLMRDGETAEEKTRRVNKDDAREFSKKRNYQRLWTLELATRELKQVTRGNVQVWGFEWSPDGRQFVLVVSDQPNESSWYKNRLALVAASGGVPQTLFAPGGRQVSFPRWSPDRRRIAFLSAAGSGRVLNQASVFVIDAKGGQPRHVTPDYPGSFGCVEWLGQGRSLLAAGHEEGEAAFTLIDPLRARVTTLWRAPVAILENHSPRFTLDRSQRRAAVVLEAPRSPWNVWRADFQPSSRRLKCTLLTDALPQVNEFALGDQEIVSWKSRDGWVIRGVLVKPYGYKKGKRYPTIVSIHGGPENLIGNGFSANGNRWLAPQLMASRGYAVFLPNFRGSTGFGLQFAEANAGDLGGADFHDIDAGVDALIARGIADPERLGVGGWSYGGFMTCWTVTQTNRYKAAVMGAGISNWQSFHGNSDIPDFDAKKFGADPYARSGPHARFSGINSVSQVKTPTLVLHGENDLRVPAEQAYQFHRGLLDHGVTTELVIYPREGHTCTEKPHWLDVRRRVIAWYDKYLK